MYELNFITDIVEEQLAKGNLRWLANFKEIHRDYAVGDITVPVYALGGLEEKGFLLSRIFSAFVTPKYKIHFLVYTSSDIDVKFLRKLIVSCKNKFGSDDWIFIEVVQSQPLQRTVKDAVRNLADNKVGVVASSIASKDQVFSENVLGKGLKKHLKLTEARFEAFDVPDYLKSFAIVFFFGTILLISLQFFVEAPAANPLSILLLFAFSAILGYQIYKSRYHTVLTLSDKGFEILKGGKSSTQGRWADFTDVAVYIASNRESFLRLSSKEKSLNLPLSRVGMSRKDAYKAISRLIKRK
ncbi:MAG: hypothetical protein OEY30_02255 [Candidatus Bathyarchaeota archaeon]|nr:hypothetical protein [Candidatus Bathyarchaeota archaeon]